MKKIFTLLVVLISLGFTSEIIASNSNQVEAKSTGCTSIEGKGVASFVVTSPQAQVCDLSFLMMPGEYEDGSFTSVTLKVNGVTLPNPITFSTYGWQAANTTGNAVTLNQGENTVQFISGRDDVPVVRNIKVGINNQGQTIIQYYNIDTDKEDSLTSYNSNETVAEDTIQEIEPIFYNYDTKVEYFYTTYIPLSFRDKTKLTLYAPSENDPMFGYYHSNIDFNVYIFNINANDTITYSKSIQSQNKSFYWQDSIPSGNYYILFEARDSCGYATLRVNSTMYKFCYTSKTNYDVSPIGNPTFTPGGYYNIFTTNIWSNQEDVKPDPILWLKKRTSNNEYIIVNYNDDNITPTNFYWGPNARIRFYIEGGAFYVNPGYSVLLSSVNPGTSEDKEWCDIYYGKLRGAYSGDADIADFPKLKQEDAIVSSIINNNADNYNCIGWSAGITYSNLWPDSIVGTKNILWFDSLYNNQPVHTVTNIFQRPSSMPRYTRNEADSANAIVALWGTIESNGDTTFTHASIRNNRYDRIPHGYDWESKLGKGVRIFHPCHALRGNDSLPGYGQIVAYYRLANESAIYSLRTMQEQVAEEDIIFETISLTESDLSIINNVITNIPLTQETNFNTLYDAWEQIVERYSYKANLWVHKDYPQYKALLSCMRNIENGEYLAYKKFAEGDFIAMLLIQDFAYSSDDTKDIWSTAFDNSNLRSVIRSQESKVNLFIQNMIEEQTNILNFGSGRRFSNTDDFNVTSSSNTITINIDIEETSTYSIEVVDLSNNYVQTVVPEIRVQAGEYEHTINVPNGNYVVAYYLNGNINSKKVTIK